MNPLTWPVLESWMRATGRVLSPHEIDALFLIDGAMRPPAGKKES